MIALARAGENGLLWYVDRAGWRCARRRVGAATRTSARSKIVLATLVANTVVKQAVRRARPVLEEELPALTPVLSGRSYPSAHASTSFAGARALLGGALPAAAALRGGRGDGAVAPLPGRALPLATSSPARRSGDAMARFMTP